MRTRVLSIMLAVASAGCGPELQDAVDAKEDALHATKAGGAIISAAEFVGLLPKYTCGEPAQVEFADFLPAVQGSLGSCAKVVDGAGTATASAVSVQLAAPGCDVFGATWTGQISATLSGGDDRTEVDLDFTGLQINGSPVDAKIGRSTCGDLDTWSVDASTRVPATAHTKQLDVAFHGTVVDRPGIPIFGTDFLILDGPATVDYGGRTLQVVFKQVWWEMGLSLPHKGELDFTDPDGHQVAVRFDDADSEMQVSVDGGRFAPVPMP